MSTRSSGKPLREPFVDPERVLRKLAKLRISGDNPDLDNSDNETSPREPQVVLDNFEMADARTLEERMKATRTGQGSAITAPAVAGEFEIKGQFLQMINNQCQFNGTHEEDANEHLRNFEGICGLFKLQALNDEATYLRVFPWTLKGEAKEWLRGMPAGSITTWTDLTDKFLQRFFPPARAAQTQVEIYQFQKKPNETLYDAWNRFCKLLRKCPQHGLSTMQKVTIFYRGSDVATREKIDNAAGGSIMKKNEVDAHQVLVDLAQHAHEWHQANETPRTYGVSSMESDEMAALGVKMDSFGRQIEKIVKDIHAIKVGCESCNGPHLTKDCPMTMEEIEQAAFLNQRPGNFQPGGRNNFDNNNNFRNYNNNKIFQPSNNQSAPGFYKHNQQHPPQQQQPSQASSSGSNLENLLSNFVTTQMKTNEQNEQSFRNQQASMQNMEKQIANLAKMFYERQPVTMPSNIQTNPKNEHAKAITTRSGATVQSPPFPSLSTDNIVNLSQDTEEKIVEKV